MYLCPMITYLFLIGLFVASCQFLCHA